MLDDLYTVCPPASRSALCAELYGREYSLFSDGIGARGESLGSLAALLASAPPAKRNAAVAALYKGMAPVLEKALLHPAMTHRLLRELLTEAPGCADGESLACGGGGGASV